jgi:hypothetical protein
VALDRIVCLLEITESQKGLALAVGSRTAFFRGDREIAGTVVAREDSGVQVAYESGRRLYRTGWMQTMDVEPVCSDPLPLIAARGGVR